MEGCSSNSAFRLSLIPSLAILYLKLVVNCFSALWHSFSTNQHLSCSEGWLITASKQGYKQYFSFRFSISLLVYALSPQPSILSSGDSAYLQFLSLSRVLWHKLAYLSWLLSKKSLSFLLLLFHPYASKILLTSLGCFYFFYHFLWTCGLMVLFF